MFLTSIILLLFSTKLVSSELNIENKVIKKEFSGQYSVLKTNNEPTFILIEIFNPSVSLNVSYSGGKFVSVFQASIFIPMRTTEFIQIQANGSKEYFWYRIINTKNVVPKDYPRYKDFQINVTTQNYWYTSIEFRPAEIFYKDWIVPKHYNLWVYPIFPKGQFSSWGTDYSYPDDDAIMSTVNSTLDSNTLKFNGSSIGTLNDQSSTMKLTIVNRKTYTNLIIIEAVFNATFSMQYPPVIIQGCGSLSDPECYLIKDYSWKIFIICTTAILFFCTLIGFGFENLLSLIFMWGILSYIFCIGFHYIFWDINNAGNNLYYIICGICPGIALFVSIFNCCACPTKSRTRIIFNVLSIVVILYHILWFAFQTFLSDFRIVVGVISGISIILFFTLLYFYEITITFGNVFISLSMAFCGISLSAINSSSYPYLFLDFFNYILYRDNSVKYYTYFLYEDLLLFVSLGLSVILIGCLTYKSYKRRNKTENSNSVSPNVDNSTITPERFTYGTISTQRFSNDLEPRLRPLDMAPPPYSSVATAPPLYDMRPYS